MVMEVKLLSWTFSKPATVTIMDDLQLIDDDYDEIDEDYDVWKILIIDDESSVHQVTTFTLKNINIFGKKLEFLSAYSASEAARILQNNNDIAVALVDVVMEDDLAGLNLIKQIREELKNDTVRLIIRTGQPGNSPESEISKNYDIHGYFNKVEISSERLSSIIYSAIRSYKDITDLKTINQQLIDLSFGIRESLNGFVGYMQIAHKTDDITRKNDALEKANNISSDLIESISTHLEKVDR